MEQHVCCELEACDTLLSVHHWPTLDAHIEDDSPIIINTAAVERIVGDRAIDRLFANPSEGRLCEAASHPVPLAEHSYIRQHYKQSFVLLLFELLQEPIREAHSPCSPKKLECLEETFFARHGNDLLVIDYVPLHSREPIPFCLFAVVLEVLDQHNPERIIAIDALVVAPRTI